MNIYDYEDIRIKLMTLTNDQLLALEVWLDDKANVKDKAQKIELLNLEIERKFKLRRIYEG